MLNYTLKNKNKNKNKETNKNKNKNKETNKNKNKNKETNKNNKKLKRIELQTRKQNRKQTRKQTKKGGFSQVFNYTQVPSTLRYISRTEIGKQISSLSNKSFYKYISLEKNKENDSNIQQLQKYIINNWKLLTKYKYDFVDVKLKNQFKNLYELLDLNFNVVDNNDIFKELTFYILFRLFYMETYNDDINKDNLKQLYTKKELEGGSNLSLLEYIVTRDKMPFVSTSTKSTSNWISPNKSIMPDIYRLDTIIQLFKKKFDYFNFLKFNQNSDSFFNFISPTKYSREYKYFKTINFKYKLYQMKDNIQFFLIHYLIIILSYNLEYEESDKYYYYREFNLEEDIEKKGQKKEEELKIKLFLNYFFNIKLYNWLYNFFTIFKIDSLPNIYFYSSYELIKNNEDTYTFRFDLFYKKNKSENQFYDEDDENKEDDGDEEDDGNGDDDGNGNGDDDGNGDGDDDGNGDGNRDRDGKDNIDGNGDKDEDKDDYIQVILEFNIKSTTKLLDWSPANSIPGISLIRTQKGFKKKNLISFQIKEIIFKNEKIKKNKNFKYMIQYKNNKFRNLKFNLINYFLKDFSLSNYLFKGQSKQYITDLINEEEKTKKTKSEKKDGDDEDDILKTERLFNSTITFFNNIDKAKQSVFKNVLNKNFESFLEEIKLNYKIDSINHSYDVDDEKENEDDKDDEDEKTVKLTDLLRELLKPKSSDITTVKGGGRILSKKTLKGGTAFKMLFGEQEEFREKIQPYLNTAIRETLITIEKEINSDAGKAIASAVVTKFEEAAKKLIDKSNTKLVEFKDAFIKDVRDVLTTIMDNTEEVSEKIGKAATQGSLDAIKSDLTIEGSQIQEELNKLVEILTKTFTNTLLEQIPRFNEPVTDLLSKSAYEASPILANILIKKSK